MPHYLCFATSNEIGASLLEALVLVSTWLHQHGFVFYGLKTHHMAMHLPWLFDCVGFIWVHCLEHIFCMDVLQAILQ